MAENMKRGSRGLRLFVRSAKDRDPFDRDPHIRVAHPEAPPLARMGLRAALSILVLGLCLWLLNDRLQQIDVQELSSAFSRISTQGWLAALGLTALSFWAVGRYDAVVHRHFATGTPARVARRAGVCAIAVSQSLGLGLVSGAILRWRMLPGVSLWQATQLTAAVALSFLMGWAVVTSAVLVSLPDAPYRGQAALALVAAAGLVALSLARPAGFGRGRFRWPNGLTLARLVGLCAVDTLAAAAAFYSLLPSGADLGAGLGFATLLPAFLLALGAGLALGTPGGMGAFEVTLLALLPGLAEPPVLAAILGWRLVYYALPALIGAGLAILGPARHIPAPGLATARPDDFPAECGLVHQGTVSLGNLSGQPWLLARTGHCLTALLNPMETHGRARIDGALRALRRAARNEQRLPVLYKCNARLAARARNAGLVARRIGWEAWLDPAEARLSASCRSGLRRKLRRAEAAGVGVTTCLPGSGALDPLIPALNRIATDWSARHGRERGFSMGRHDPDYLGHQRVYIGWHAGRAIAYVSFHVAPQEWTLDLMRHGDDLPDGTMQCLIATALADAAAEGVARFSLAAVPDAALPRSPDRADLVGRLMAALAPELANPGLYRFKAGFAPRWSPLYLAAPRGPGLVLAGLSLWRAITRPPPLPPAALAPRRACPPPPRPSGPEGAAYARN